MTTIVFDFDKTLTYKDSLTQFFVERMKSWRAIFLPYYFILKILSKYGFISISKEKELSFAALCPTSDSIINNLLVEFTDRIKLNDINERVLYNIKEGNRVIILSASPEVYLKKLYPSCDIIGLQLSNRNGIKIAQHPYGLEKLSLLKKKGITQIDEFYYDSHSDEFVFPLCKKAYKISKGKIIEEKSFK